jgi:hypothetical protein
MKSMLLALCLLAPAAAAVADTSVTVVVNETAQQAAENNARRGSIGHCARRAGRYEGCGFSPASADQAVRSCCFWGRRPVREIGVARGVRGWYAVVWYE